MNIVDTEGQGNIWSQGEREGFTVIPKGGPEMKRKESLHETLS